MTSPLSSPGADGSKLAVPIELSPTAPEGFEGQADEWVEFGGTLWTLHAWVWKDNRDGLFNPTNSRVQCRRTAFAKPPGRRGAPAASTCPTSH